MRTERARAAASQEALTAVELRLSAGMIEAQQQYAQAYWSLRRDPSDVIKDVRRDLELDAEAEEDQRTALKGAGAAGAASKDVFTAWGVNEVLQ